MNKLKKLAGLGQSIWYDYIRREFITSGELEKLIDWDELQGRRARVQRLLWASTGTKNPLYPDTKYVDELIGQDTVNTVPPATLTHFLDHGTVRESLLQGWSEAHKHMEELKKLGIDLDAITGELLHDGVQSFAASFQALLDSIAQKRDQLLEDGQKMVVAPGPHQAAS